MTQPITEIAQELRDLTGWTETQIAEAVGVSQPTINRILSGQRDCRLSTYQRLVLLLDEMKRR